MRIRTRVASHPYEQLPPALQTHGPRKRSASPAGGNAQEAGDLPTQQQVLVDRLRSDVKERDAALTALRHEVTLLKALERRKQKELDDMEEANTQIPRQLERLREENGALKARLKQVSTGQAASDRRLRLQDDTVARLRAQVSQLEEVAASQNLRERHELQRDLAAAQDARAQAVERARELQHLDDLTQKNAAHESRTLRARNTALESHAADLQAQVEALELALREKKDEVANLVVYRYNALHRRPEQACKSCAARQQLETQQRQRQEVVGRMPVLAAPTAVLTTDTEATVTVEHPGFEKGGSCTAVHLCYREKGKSDWTTILVDASSEHVEEPVAGKTGRTFQKPAAASSTETAETGPCTFRLKRLQLGKTYELYVVPASQSVLGTPSQTTTFVFDEPNAAPGRPQVYANCDVERPSVQLVLQPPAQRQGTPTLHYVLERQALVVTRSLPRAERELADLLAHEPVTPVEGSVQPGETTYAVDASVRCGFLYAYRAVAVNQCGRSTPGPWSEPVLVDRAPDAPQPPTVAILDATTVRLKIVLDDQAVSEIHSVRVSASGVRPVVHADVLAQLAAAAVDQPAAVSGSVHSSHDSLVGASSGDAAPAPLPVTSHRDRSVNASRATLGGTGSRAGQNSRLRARQGVAGRGNTGETPAATGNSPGSAEDNPQRAQQLQTQQQQLMQAVDQAFREAAPSRTETVRLESAVRRELPNGAVEWAVDVKQLAPGVVYTFTVAAVNYAGAGDASRPSAQVAVDYLPPATAAPDVRLLAPNALRIALPSVPLSLHTPQLRGYRVYGARVDWPYSTSVFNRSTSAAGASEAPSAAASAAPDRGSSAVAPNAQGSAPAASAQDTASSRALLRQALRAINPGCVASWTTWRELVPLDQTTVDVTNLDQGASYWVRVSLITDTAVGDPSPASMVILSAALPLMPGQAAYRNGAALSSSPAPALQVATAAATSQPSATPPPASAPAAAPAAARASDAVGGSLASLGHSKSRSLGSGTLNRSQAAAASSSVASSRRGSTQHASLPLGTSVALDARYRNMHDGNPAMLQDTATGQFGTRQSRLLQRSKERLEVPSGSSAALPPSGSRRSVASVSRT